VAGEAGEEVEGPGGVRLWRVASPVEVPVDLSLEPVAADGPPLDPAEARRRRDRVEVERLLGRPPRSSFAVVVRDLATGAPVVIRNPPLLDDGTPMPTRYWLVAFTAEVGTLEAAGGVRAAEADVDTEALAAAHARHAAERDEALPEGWSGPRPSGGVGGTRRGVKCLHTHYANWLATGDDPIGAWTHEHLSP
jgi:hypothetical protein